MSGIIGSSGSKSGVIGQTELDYEEGTWTPTFNDFTNVGTVSGRVCNYVRIGNIVNYWIDVWQTNNNMSWTTAARIDSVPTFHGQITSFHSAYNGIVYISSGVQALHCKGYTQGGYIYLTEAHSTVRHLWINGSYALAI